MKICLYGAGSIGGIIGAHLARVQGVEVSLIARGAHLDAIRRNGLRLISPHEDFTVKVNATDDPAQLGPQDVVFITLKTHQYLAALDTVEEFGELGLGLEGADGDHDRNLNWSTSRFKRGRKRGAPTRRPCGLKPRRTPGGRSCRHA